MLFKLKDEHFEATRLKGWVEVDLPSNPLERLKIASGVALEGSDIASTMKQGEAMAQLAWDRIKALSLKDEETGIEFESLEAISQYAVCTTLLYAIGGIILNGLPLGKG